ncbi:MAG: gfo/Idh/MocA family oxidoreductase [Planctomycetota bacterium]|nr:MAG: gfo/Idh/MocA family oxidoreductase [Planctomycetota bacterium]
MQLKPEEKAVGTKNFVNVVTHPETKKAVGDRGINRRDFLVGAGAAGAVAAAGLGASYFGYTKIERPLRVGIIGTGDEGGVLIGNINPEYIQVVAIADIRPYNVHRAFHGDQSSPNAAKIRKGLMNIYGWKTEEEARKNVKVFDDEYTELLKESEVEAVIIALPLHLHAKAAIQAMRAGKHVLTEKLMGHSIAECKEMARVSYETGKILATGHQRHYSVLYENSVDLIRLGLLGTLHHIRAQWHRQTDTWSPALPDQLLTKDGDAAGYKQLEELKQLEAELKSFEGDTGKLVKEKLKRASQLMAKSMKDRIAALRKNVELAELRKLDAKVNAKKYGYEDKDLPGRKDKRSAMEELIRWRLWERTGGGLMAELGSHQLDASSIFISAMNPDGHKVLPLSVNATGGVHLLDPTMRECEDHVYCFFEFPGAGYYEDYEKLIVKDPNRKVVVTYSSINGNGFGGYGEVVMGDKGTLVLEQEQNVMVYKGNDTSTEITVKKDAKSGVLDTTASGPPQLAQAATTIGEVSKGYKEEMEHFAWCVRNLDEAALKEKKWNYEKNPRCHPKVAMADAVIALTSNISIRENRRIDFKKEWFDIDKDETPEGNKPRSMSELAKL